MCVSKLQSVKMRLLIILFLAFNASAQIGTGQWRLHTPAYYAKDVVANGSKIYTAYGNGVSEYDRSSSELTTWDAVSGLSDISISCLGFSSSQNAVFIGYENGNIDKLKDNEVTNLPSIVLAQVQGSKKIHKIVEYNNFLYFATGFAIVKIDPSKNEVKETYYPTNGNDAILDIAFRNDTVFALAEDRLYFGLSSSPILADPSSWTEDSRVPVISGEKYKDIEVAEGALYVSRINTAYGQDSIFVIGSNAMSNAVTESFAMEINSLQKIGGKLAVNYVDILVVYNQNMSMSEAVYTYGSVSPRPKASVKLDNTFFIADAELGLVMVEGITGQRIAIEGPPNDTYYSMDWSKGRLAIVSGGLSGIFHTYSSGGVCVFNDEKWTGYNATIIPEWNGAPIYDYLGVSVNPTDPDEIAVGTFSSVPLTIINDGVADTLTAYNSDLGEHTNGSGETFISDLQYDNSGNLWVVNGMASSMPLKVLTKDGAWYSMNTGSSTMNKFSRRLDIDGNGNKWFALNNVGLIGFNDGGSIDDPGDDKKVILNTGESSGALPSLEINAIAVDMDNEVWIGTDNGFAVLYNSSSAFDALPGDYNAQRIKIEFEGNVEYVLGATNITAIEVDGANRKWFGTANAGIILLSEDGLEIIEQHTTDNSPLISNAIIDLEMDQSTGELFIVTDKGLISYRTDATEGKDNYDEVTVFPNPKRPDYDGPITIQGIKFDSDVKITDAAGRLVYQTTSNGGTATWNGRGINGEKVSTGIYLIWTAPNDPDVKGRKVGKVLVVNEP